MQWTIYARVHKALPLVVVYLVVESEPSVDIIG